MLLLPEWGKFCVDDSIPHCGCSSENHRIGCDVWDMTERTLRPQEHEPGWVLWLLGRFTQHRPVAAAAQLGFSTCTSLVGHVPWPCSGLTDRAPAGCSGASRAKRYQAWGLLNAFPVSRELWVQKPQGSHLLSLQISFQPFWCQWKINNLLR